MLKVKDYPFLEVKDIISLEDENGNIFSIKDGLWRYILEDKQNNKTEINKEQLKELYVRKAHNKKIVLCISKNAETNKIGNFGLFTRNVNSIKDIIFNDINRRYNYFLYFYKPFTKELEKITEYDELIDDLSKVWNQELKFPKSIKRFYFNKENRNKIVISLNKHLGQINNKFLNSLENYDKKFKLLSFNDIEDMEEKLFYYKMKNIVDFKRKIVYYEFNNFEIIGKNFVE